MASPLKKTDISKLPIDAMHLTMEFLAGNPVQVLKSDNKAIVNFTFACKFLHETYKDERDSALARLRKKMEWAQIERSYPETLNAVFRTQSLSIGQYPVLDLSAHPDSDYIDYLKPSDLSAPIMRFTEQHWGRPGIAIKIQSNNNRRSVVFTIFQRYAFEPNGRWETGGSSFDAMMLVYRRRHWNETGGVHIEVCPTCPPGALPEFYTIFAKILAGTDPLFRIAQPAASEGKEGKKD